MIFPKDPKIDPSFSLAFLLCFPQMGPTGEGETQQSILVSMRDLTKNGSFLSGKYFLGLGFWCKKKKKKKKKKNRDEQTIIWTHTIYLKDYRDSYIKYLYTQTNNNTRFTIQETYRE